MSKIWVVGLGPGDVSGLPMGTYKLLKSGRPIVLRTTVHPVVDTLRSEGIAFVSFDELYETGEAFEQIYEEMARRLLAMAASHGEVVYAVPGHPLMAEQSVQNLYRMAGDVEVEVGPGQSFLDAVCTALKIDPIEGFLLLDGTSFSSTELQVGLHTFVVQVYSPSVASDVKLTLMEVYPDDYEIVVVRAARVEGQERILRIPLHELDRVEWIDHLTTVYLPPAVSERVHYTDPWFVTGLVRRLREPDGCPWDRKQTHASLRKYVLEEAYEVAHAIDEDNPDALADELGDLLLQVLLHAQIASESGDFTIRDVYAALASKLVRRHPHVFGEQTAKSVSDANEFWNQAKAAEAEPKTRDALLVDKVKWARHPLSVARDLQEKAATVGFDWEDVSGVVDKLKEEVAELEQEVGSSAGSRQRIEEEFGDVLFTLVNVARWLDIDIDRATTSANKKFAERFRFVEQKLKENTSTIANNGASDLEKYWNQAKTRGKSAEVPLD